MAKQAPRPKNGKNTKVYALAGLALVAVVAIVLALLAVTQNRNGVDTAGTVPTLTPATTLPPEPEPTPESEPEPLPEPPTAPVAQRLLSVSPDGTILRAWVGSCEAPGALEVSFDGGTTWVSGATETIPATRIMQIDAEDPTITRLASLNAECAPQFSRSFVGGVSWEPEPDAGAWFIDPLNTSAIHSPSGVQALPCEAVGLDSAGARAIAMCADASVTTSEDGGASWSPPVAVPYAVAVAVTPEAYAVVSGGEPDCAGVRTRTLSGGALSEPGACLSGADGRDGTVALAAAPGAWFVWVGDSLTRSIDGGLSWGI